MRERAHRGIAEVPEKAKDFPSAFGAANLSTAKGRINETSLKPPVLGDRALIDIHVALVRLNHGDDKLATYVVGYLHQQALKRLPGGSER